MKGVRAVVPDVPYRPADVRDAGADRRAGTVGAARRPGERRPRRSRSRSSTAASTSRRTRPGTTPAIRASTTPATRCRAGYPKGDTRFTNKKVIVARAYFRPSDPPATGNETPIQGPGGSPHGTHTAGTVACNANTPAVGPLTISGIAPAAWLMNYRIFYPSNSPDPFENGNGWTVEIVQAIEDAVRDGADVLSNSWGSSHQNTLDWPDPMVEAAEAAVDAGVVGVWAQGNSGPATATGNLPSASDKVISVGAVTKYADTDPVDRQRHGADAGAGRRSRTWTQARRSSGRRWSASTSAQPCTSRRGRRGGERSRAAARIPAGSMTGKIALIQRGGRRLRQVRPEGARTLRTQARSAR